MLIRVVKAFRDRENGMCIREPGETYETTDDRGAFLKGLGLVADEISTENEKPLESAENAENGTPESAKPKRRRKKTE